MLNNVFTGLDAVIDINIIVVDFIDDGNQVVLPIVIIGMRLTILQVKETAVFAEEIKIVLTNIIT